jgi:mycothiol synthase
VIYRRVQVGEIDAGIRLLLSGRRGTPEPGQVRGFIAFAEQRGVDPAEMLVAVEGAEICWALLPAVGPGHTALILSPSIKPPTEDGQHVVALAAMACGMLGGRNVRLAQLLMDPAETQLIGLYESCGFERLAELIYMRREVHPGETPTLPIDARLIPYRPQVHGLFREALGASYEGSLDCPALNGRRELDDVLAGHRGSGEFDPDWWTLLSLSDRPAGLLLLSAPVGGIAAELVYLGLARWARGKGLGELLMRVAMHDAARRGTSELTLAVDALNVPALSLYQRLGMRRVTSRIALMRDLTPGAPPLVPKR